MNSRIIFILVISLLSNACKMQNQMQNQQTQMTNIAITDSMQIHKAIETLILPYKKQIDVKMNTVLAYNPVTLTKEGYNNGLGNMMCDAILQEIGKKYSGKVDFCLMNIGGIRRPSLSKGNITKGHVFELFPFDNEIVVASFKGSELYALIDYFKKYPKEHPFAGAQLTINQTESSLKINNQALNPDATYYVVTNDYLTKGGDNMTFFTKAQKIDHTQLKIRDFFIDYFDQIDTLKVSTSTRMLIEKKTL